MQNKETYKLYFRNQLELSSESLEEAVETAAHYQKEDQPQLRIEKCIDLDVEHLIKKHSYTKYQEYLALKEQFENLTEQEYQELEEFKKAKRAWNEIAINTQSRKINLTQPLTSKDVYDYYNK